MGTVPPTLQGYGFIDIVARLWYDGQAMDDPSSGFQRVTTSPRVSESVVSQIRAAILRGRFRPGDRLPAQRELAVEFGVGRSAVLEALRVLEKSGLIVIRTGGAGGAFVAAPSIDHVSESLGLFLHRAGATMDELAEFRAVLEGEAFYLAALRGSDQALAAVDAQLQALKCWREDNAGSWTEFIDQELELHYAVAQLCGNRIYMAVLQAIESWETSFSVTIPTSAEARLFADWESMVDALKQRDAGRVRAVVCEHIAEFSRLASGAAS